VSVIVVSKVLRYDRHMLMRDHTVLPATHTFIHEWNEPSCHYFTAIEHHALAGTHFPSH